ncbi:hypothetical protein NDU88_002570 [Pleurodeles waltl]|uniref:Uncharacterized protein n=1 Tax=Pleurodeles waltl TaxID=8319 RepID=A0AAV7W109_PLEWA|nr:hypothetical protein NDU88_002570 [Pleurodeles waltl]
MRTRLWGALLRVVPHGNEPLCVHVYYWARRPVLQKHTAWCTLFYTGDEEVPPVHAAARWQKCCRNLLVFSLQSRLPRGVLARRLADRCGLAGAFTT